MHGVCSSQFRMNTIEFPVITHLKRFAMRHLILAALIVFPLQLRSSMARERGPLRGGLNIVFGLDPGHGNYDGVVGNRADHWNFVDVGVTRLLALRDSRGNRTSVDFFLSENDGEWGITGHRGIYHAYLYHNQRDVDLQVTLEGLPRGKYEVYVYAHGDAPNQNAEVELIVGKQIVGRKATLNDGSWDFRLARLSEGNQYVRFRITVRGDKPVQITSRRSGSSYSMFNAIQIMPIQRAR